MCLAVPSKIVEINGPMARIDADGVQRECNLMMLEDVAEGDYVIVHAGFAIQKVDEARAKDTIELMREMLALSESSN